jgi:hypothetical protein
MPSDAESKPSDSRLGQQFLEIAADVAEGGLVFPPPFDVASAAALAANEETGNTAEGMFAVTAARQSRYMVRIVEVQDEVEREVVDTTCIGQGPLFALLEDVMDQIESMP